MKSSLCFASALALLAVLPACSTQRPVLYPNRHLKQVGGRVAELDIEDCMRRAENSVSYTASKGKTIEGAAIDAGSGAAVGAAAGAAGGAVVGRAGTAAAVGAAGGGAAGATRSLIRNLFRKRAPSPVYRNFVNRCLRDKGYDPIGWN